MTPPAQLLAKSPPKQPGRAPLTLLQHCLDTEEAAHALFRLDRRWGQNFCRFFGIDTDTDRARFLLNVRVAGLFHDIGKANEHFQRAVQSTGMPPQTLRHEHLSGLILCLPEMRAWLSGNPALDVDAITAAVLSHHLKVTDAGDPRYKWCQPRAEEILTMHLDDLQVAALLDRVHELAELPAIPELPRAPWADRPPWSRAFRDGWKRARRLRQHLKDDPARRALLLAVKAGVIVADSAASGLVRTGQPITAWIDQTAHARTLTAHDLDHAIIDPRCSALESKLEQPFTFHEFQVRTAQLGPRALLLAGCGSGKTLAAWNWARAQLAEHELGHVVFLYPTRGTATEGFRDYVGWAPEDEAQLLHGSAEYELAEMRANPSDAIRGKDFGPSEAQARMFALGLWSRRYFSATVDQFLAFLEHRYESLCLLPLLADSAVILDEVHSYDQAMFTNLVAFLSHFRGPVLCMTATLPPQRRIQLEECGLRVYPQENDRNHLQDLRAAEEHKRYRLRKIDGPVPARSLALEAYREGRRVLWVVNTVARCQELALSLRRELANDGSTTVGSTTVGSTEVLAYHSRYRMSDRQGIHAATVRSFQQRGQPALAVTTQVCEMSLDLDADVLITELAPVPSLVQRLGRANRHAEPGDPGRADVLVYEPERDLPYTTSDMKAARQLLAHFLPDPDQRAELSQFELAEALETFSPPEPQVRNGARFTESGYFAIPGSFRDDDGFSTQCVLDADVSKLQPYAHDRRALQRELPAYFIGVPRSQALDEAELPAWLPPYLKLAPAERYRPDIGFLSEKLAGELP